MPIDLIQLESRLRERLAEVSDKLETTMQDLLPEQDADTGEGRVVEAMRYSLLGGGKRLRPYLVCASAQLFGVCNVSAYYAAAAIEFVHTYSLIHDDLPSMDNDDMRRGKPSCHKQFDEATALLAGDALLTMAFDILASEHTHQDPKVRLELISALAKAAGHNGMVGGQMRDLQAEQQNLPVEEIIRLQRLKTGRMFGVSCEAGAILGKADMRRRQALVRYAHDIGLAFQMTDDLLDVEGSEAETGKAVRKDKTAGKATLVGAMGVERAREQAFVLADQAKNHLRVFDERAEPFRELADFVVNRRS